MINFGIFCFSQKELNFPQTPQASYSPLFQEKRQRVSCRSLLAFLFLLVLCIPLQGQEPPADPSQEAKAVLDDLRSGVLIVRLPAYQNKITALEQAINSNDVTENNKANLQQQLDEVRAKREDQYPALMWAFAENYTFSDVLFMYDTDTHLLNDGQQSGYLLDSTLQVNQNLSLDGRPYAVLRWGNTNRATSTGSESLVLMTADGNDLRPPFPYAFKINRPRYLFDKFFSPSKAEGRNFEKIVQKMEQSWINFYLKMGGGM